MRTTKKTEGTAKKVNETKTVVAAVPAEVAEPKTEEKAAEPKKRGRKPAAKTDKAAGAAKKTAKTIENEIFVQHDGVQLGTKEAMERVLADYASKGNDASAAKSVELYIKVEERKVYYTINKKGGDQFCITY